MSFDLELWWAKTSFGTDARLSTYRKIGVMLRNGVRLEKVLDDLYRRASEDGKKPKEAMAVLFDSWRGVVLNGGRLSDALDGWVPYGEKMIIQAGEEAGKLPENLDAVINVVKSSKKIKSVVFGGLVYPAALLAATLVYLFIFGLKVIPEFTKIVNPEKWGSLAKSLYIMSQYVQSYGIPSVVLIVIFFAAVAASMPRLGGNIRVTLDRAPPFSVYRLVTGSGFMLALSALIAGGQRIQDALASLGTSASPYLKERLDGFLLGVNSGMKAGDAMRYSGYDFPSKEIIDDLTVYAEHSNDFSEALQIIAREWLEDGVERITAQMKVLSGMAIMTMAGFLMWIVAGFFAIQQEIAGLSRGMMH